MRWFFRHPATIRRYCTYKIWRSEVYVLALRPYPLDRSDYRFRWQPSVNFCFDWIDMHELLNDLTEELARFLNVTLPGLSADWWKTNVLGRLSENQIEAINTHRYERLSQLDLAALLRVFDRNWYEIRTSHAMPTEGRNWLKELQSIRNRWAHMNSEGRSAADLYRDLDTLVRFLKMIEARESKLNKVRSARDRALSKISKNVTPTGDHGGRNSAGERGSIYDILRDHLQSLKEHRWEADFQDIEGVLGRSLPASAYRYPAWWANQKSHPSVQCESWMSAGWRVEGLDLSGRRVSFHRTGPEQL